MPAGKMSKCYKKHFLENLYSTLKIGDLLEFQRTGYAHWAVYVGLRLFEDEYHHCVINRAVPVDADKKTLLLASRSAQKLEKVASRVVQIARSESNNIGDIHLQDIKSVLGNDRVRVNNSKDKKWRPKESEEIVARAEEALNAIYNTPYHLLNNNCEHFANGCRYGRRRSQQVPDVLLKTGSAVASFVVPIAARSAACALILPAVGIAATGPIGLAITGGSIGVAILGAAIPPVVHAIQCKLKK